MLEATRHLVALFILSTSCFQTPSTAVHLRPCRNVFKRSPSDSQPLTGTFSTGFTRFTGLESWIAIGWTIGKPCRSVSAGLGPIGVCFLPLSNPVHLVNPVQNSSLSKTAQKLTTTAQKLPTRLPPAPIFSRLFLPRSRLHSP